MKLFQFSTPVGFWCGFRLLVVVNWYMTSFGNTISAALICFRAVWFDFIRLLPENRCANFDTKFVIVLMHAFEKVNYLSRLLWIAIWFKKIKCSYAQSHVFVSSFRPYHSPKLHHVVSLGTKWRNSTKTKNFFFIIIFYFI